MSSKKLIFFGKRKQHCTPLLVIQICGGRGMAEIRGWVRAHKISEEKETTNYSLERGKSLWSFFKSVVPSKKKLRENDTSSV
jgi:hypothetical protein